MQILPEPQASGPDEMVAPKSTNAHILKLNIPDKMILDHLTTIVRKYAECAGVPREMRHLPYLEMRVKAHRRRITIRIEGWSSEARKKFEQLLLEKLDLAPRLRIYDTKAAKTA